MNIDVIAAFIIGTLFGSFFHAIAERYLNGSLKAETLKSLFSRSKCPGCGAVIEARFLIPVFGYLLTRAKCYRCGYAISPAYPVFELIHGFTAAALVTYGGIGLLTVFTYFIFACAITSSWIDIKSMIMPDFLNAAIFLMAIYPVIASSSVKESLYGLALMFVFFLVILLIFPGSFGGGDVKFASAAGFFLGLELSVVMLEVSLISGAITGILYALITRRGFKSKIPFGPFLTAGLFIAYFFGRDIILLYYSFIG